MWIPAQDINILIFGTLSGLPRINDARIYLCTINLLYRHIWLNMGVKKYVFHFLLFLVVGALSAQPVADFKADRISGCKPITVNFTDESTGSPTSWIWDFGNGNTSFSQNPSAVYLNPGTYTVKLTVSNGSGSDTKTKVAFITVFDSPKANFSYSPKTVCVGQLMTFTDSTILASAPIKLWDWVFGDGNSQNTSVGSVTHAFTYGSTFPVTLLVSDTNKCSSNIVIDVTVAPGPVASFTATPTTQCGVPLTTTFTNNSTVTGAASYTWYFGDGATSTLANPTHTYTTKGIYSVSLVIIQGACRDSITQVNLINLKPIAAAFKADTTKICAGQTVTFTDQSNPLPASYSWYFGDGGVASVANPAYIYSTPGTYTVSEKVTDGGVCSDSIAKVSFITVFPQPKAFFRYNVQAACSAPIVVAFTDSSTGASTWAWDFGDAITSALQNPTHSYAVAGSYTVKLVVTNANGCTDTYQTSIANVSPATADFSAFPQKGCVPLNVKFTSLSTVPGDSIINYSWNFGNGTANTGNTNINNIYAASGIYDVKLVIKTKLGCTDSVAKVKYIKAGAKPTVDFGIVDSTLCYGVNAAFNNYSTNGNSYLWDFGDGGKDTVMNPIHLYGDTGTFTVKLVAYNNGCADSLTRPNIVTIYPPKPVFSYKVDCSSHFNVLFTDASIGADSLTWDFGDGTFDVSNNKTPAHTYLTRGPKTIVLTAFNRKYGCSYTASQSLIVTDPVPAFSASPLVGCYPLFVSFSDASQDAAQYKWLFGNGDSSMVKNASELYGLPGLYNVKLIITDVNGCSDTLNKPKYIDVLGPLPYFKADTTKGCAPLNVLFTDTTHSDSTLVNWAWDFGDGGTASITTKTVSHLYINPGSYNVSMTVTDKNGCAKTLVKTNYIVPTFPKPQFVTDTLSCRGKLVNFNASATNASAPVYKWYFADGSVDSVSGAITTHAYSNYGLYKATLVVKDGNGCTDSVKHSVFIHKPHADFSDSALSIGCGVKQVQFKDLSTGYVNKWNWDFGTGGGSSVAQNPSYTYTQSGYYNVRLIATSIAGCVDTLVADSVVLVPGPFGTFTFSPQTGCAPLTVKFKANSNNSEDYTWDFGDGTVITTTSNVVTHTYNKDINITPILLLGSTLPDGSFCQQPAKNLTGNIVVSTTTSVNINPKVITLLDGDFTACTPTTNISGPFITQWSPSDGLDCSSCFDVMIKSLGHNMVYYLTVIDTTKGGCAAHDTLTVIDVPCKENFVIPNVFSPNGDGKNDAFKVTNLCPGFKFEMSIYNRWGELMFVTDSNRAGWDGNSAAGVPAVNGTYYYVININKRPYTGFVMLLRE